jgi:uncharacterized membrane protein YbhN (UPF0104 family)
LAAGDLLPLVSKFDLDKLFLVTPLSLLLVGILFVTIQFLNIFYFQLIIHDISSTPFSYKLLPVLLASYTMNFTGPLKLSMPARVLLFKLVLDIPYGAGVAVVMLATVLDVAVLAVLVLTMAVWVFVAPLAGLLLGAGIVLVLFGLVAIFRRLPYRVIQRPEWLHRFLVDTAKLSPTTFLYVLFISAAKSLLTALAGWFILTDLGTTCKLAQFALVYFASHLAGVVSLIPWGIGIKDASLTELLSRFGTSVSTSVTFVALDRIIWLLIPVVIGLLAGWQLGVSALIRSANKEMTA